MVTVWFNRKTGEAFAVQNSAFFIKEVFESGLRNRADFESCNSTGFIQIKKEPNGRFNVTTVDDPGVL